jgi:hypothetical protein
MNEPVVQFTIAEAQNVPIHFIENGCCRSRSSLVSINERVVLKEAFAQSSSLFDYPKNGS